MIRVSARLAPSLLLALLALLTACSDAVPLNQQGIARLNQDVGTLWADDGIPLVEAAARAGLDELVGVVHPAGPDTTASVVEVRSVSVDAPRAPGLTRLDGARIAARLPLAGAWRVAAELGVRVVRRGPAGFDEIFAVRIALRRLRGAFRVDLDSSDPAAPRIVGVEPPAADFAFALASPPAAAPFLGWLDHAALADVASAVVLAGTRQLAQGIDLRITGTPEPLGLGGPEPDLAEPVDVEAAAIALEEQALATKLPFGSIFEMRYRDPYDGTWAVSLADPTLPLEPDGYASLEGSAGNTGLLLGALAYRYAATRSPQTLGEVARLLESTRILLTMKGRPGDLNRWILPRAALTSPPDGDAYVVRFGGVDYVASDYISRDDYLGVLFGLSSVHELVDAAELRTDAGQQIELAVDYLLANGWTWRKRDGSYGERWQGVIEQQYAWLLAAHRVNPAKYAPLRAAYRGLADLLWMRAWIAVMDPHGGDQRFVPLAIALHTVLRYETDPVRWQRAYQAIAIQRRFIGHHQNALFDAVYLAAASDPTDREPLKVGIQDGLTRLLRQPRRKIATDVSGDPTIERTVYAPRFDPALGFLGFEPPAPVEIARYPIPIERRVSAGFAWSSSPFALRLDAAAVPDPYREGESIDFLLPYWMSR